MSLPWYRWWIDYLSATCVHHSSLSEEYIHGSNKLLRMQLWGLWINYLFALGYWWRLFGLRSWRQHSATLKKWIYTKLAGRKIIIIIIDHNSSPEHADISTQRASERPHMRPCKNTDLYENQHQQADYVLLGGSSTNGLQIHLNQPPLDCFCKASWLSMSNKTCLIAPRIVMAVEGSNQSVSCDIHHHVSRAN